MWPTVSSFPEIKAFIAQQYGLIFFDASFFFYMYGNFLIHFDIFLDSVFKTPKPRKAIFVWKLKLMLKELKAFRKTVYKWMTFYLLFYYI